MEDTTTSSENTRPVFGKSRAPVPALTLAEVGLWAAGTPDEEAAADAAVTDQDIEAALADALCWTPLDLAQRLSLAKGGLFIPAGAIAHRIATSQHLQDSQQAAQDKATEAAFGKPEALKREVKIEQEQRHQRNRGPRCGGRTLFGDTCQRKVVPGRHRCPRHGGKPLTEAGRARIVEAQRKRWAAYHDAGLVHARADQLNDGEQCET